MSNQQKLDEVHSQTNNRGSWFFTHIADTLLNRPIRNFRKGKTEKDTTTPAMEIGYLPDNFRVTWEKEDAVLAEVKALRAEVQALGKGA
jgi:hypothetical protein